MRATKHILVAVIAPASIAGAQWSGGIGPVGQLSSTASTWRTSASLWGTARFENSLVTSDISGQLTSGSGALRFGSVAGRQQFFSASMGGLRAITTFDFDRRSALDPRGASEVGATSSLSYRRGFTGAWLGVRADKDATAALRMGSWRQLGDWLTFAISSSLRRGTYGARSVRYYTKTFPDSTPSERIYGDSASAGRKLSWLETEATLGWSRGRVALDGVVGYRPAIDTAREAKWFRAVTTIAISKNVSLSAGAGTTTKAIPYARSTGRYASIGVRLAPAALVRPRETPEITPAASSFRIDRVGDQCVIRVRVPQARVVELSGDFNQWQPVRLTRDVDGTWTLVVDLKPGAYRVNLRVDGERWLPPPGTTAVDDEFNGKVGLVVVR